MANKIVLNPGLDWDSLPVSKTYVSLDRNLVIDRLRRAADEWREACGSQDLDNVLGSVGSLLVDFCMMLDLSREEITALLGGPLVQ